jgi:formyltetrahydrofolate-dependent phosphoribosylglycinamide formyltransferase
MFEGLQKKWKVGAGRLVLILMTFAIGGSATGYVARKIMILAGIKPIALYILAYIVLITLIWPLMVLLISLPFGQFFFFRKYIRKIGARIGMPGRGSTTKNRHAPGNPPKNLVIFASGAGSNALAIINYFRDSVSAKVVLIVCNKPGAGVIAIAEKENIPVLLIEKERFFKGDAYLPDLKNKNADLIVLAGFLWKIPQALVSAYQRRIINIHPALLPKYGGRGMYGAHVHEAVLYSREMESGITIHYVDEHYDNGDIIFQTACPVLKGDSAETLAHRVHQLEHLHYPPTIEAVLKSL